MGTAAGGRTSTSAGRSADRGSAAVERGRKRRGAPGGAPAGEGSGSRPGLKKSSSLDFFKLGDDPTEQKKEPGQKAGHKRWNRIGDADSERLAEGS
mgnify:CR=1 FL=1